MHVINRKRTRPTAPIFLSAVTAGAATRPPDAKQAAGSLRTARTAGASLRKRGAAPASIRGPRKPPTAIASLKKDTRGSLKNPTRTQRKSTGASLKAAKKGSLDAFNKKLQGSDVKGAADPNRLLNRKGGHRMQTLQARAGSLSSGTLAKVQQHANAAATKLSLGWGTFYSLPTTNADQVRVKLVLNTPQLSHKRGSGQAHFLTFIVTQLLLGKPEVLGSDDRQDIINKIEFQWPGVDISEGLQSTGFDGSVVVDVSGNQKKVAAIVEQITARSNKPPRLSKTCFEILKLHFLQDRLDRIRNDGFGYEKDIGQHVDIVMNRMTDLWPTHDSVIRDCESLEYSGLQKLGLMKSIDAIPALGLIQCHSSRLSAVKKILQATNPQCVDTPLSKAKYKTVTELAGGTSSKPVHKVELGTGLPGSDTSSTSVAFFVNAKDPTEALFSEFLKFYVDEGHKQSVDTYIETNGQEVLRGRVQAGIGRCAEDPGAEMIRTGYALHTFYLPQQNMVQLVMRYSSRGAKQHQVRYLVSNYVAHAVCGNLAEVEAKYDRFLQRTLRQISGSPDYVFSRTFNVIIGGERGDSIPLVRGIKAATFAMLLKWLTKLIQGSSFSIQTNCSTDLTEMEREKNTLGTAYANTYEKVDVLESNFREPQAGDEAAVFRNLLASRKARNLKAGKKTQIGRVAKQHRRQAADDRKNTDGV